MEIFVAIILPTASSLRELTFGEGPVFLLVFLSGESHGQGSQGAWWATVHGVTKSQICLK